MAVSHKSYNFTAAGEGQQGVKSSYEKPAKVAPQIVQVTAGSRKSLQPKEFSPLLRSSQPASPSRETVQAETPSPNLSLDRVSRQHVPDQGISGHWRSSV